MHWTGGGFLNARKLDGDDAVGVSGECGVLEEGDHAALRAGRCILHGEGRQSSRIVCSDSSFDLGWVVRPAREAGANGLVELTEPIHDVLFESRIAIRFHEVSEVGDLGRRSGCVEQVVYEFLLSDRLGEEGLGLEEHNNEEDACECGGPVDHAIVLITTHAVDLTRYSEKGRVFCVRKSVCLDS